MFEVKLPADDCKAAEYIGVNRHLVSSSITRGIIVDVRNLETGDIVQFRSMAWCYRKENVNHAFDTGLRTDNGDEVNHRDGVKSNPSVVNLDGCKDETHLHRIVATVFLDK
ncbi:hypothetical protein SPFM1_00285 [Salmonella phage SPFM1]|nr:hypothetical protein SPFM1_00285 [Salmonella phage SPFM1]